TQAKPGGILKSSISFDVDTLDPITTKSFKTSVLAAYTYGRLLKFKTGKGQFADGSVAPDVAARWEQPDETTLVLHLRDGLKFDQRPPTSGRLLNAEDVVLSWQK